MRITVRGCAKSHKRRPLRFEGISEQAVEGATVGEDELRDRLESGVVQCQRGGELRPGTACLDCHRLVNVRPMAAALTIRCLWTDEDQVSSLMTLRSALVTVARDASASRARALLEANQIDHLIVVAGDRLAGVVSRHDLQGVPDTIPIERCVSACPWVIDDTASLADAASVMVERDVSALPVVRHGEVCGMITRSDLSRAGANFI